MDGGARLPNSLLACAANGDRSEADVDQTLEKQFKLFTKHLNTMNRQMVAGNAERTSFFLSPCWDVSK